MQTYPKWNNLRSETLAPWFWYTPDHITSSIKPTNTVPPSNGAEPFIQVTIIGLTTAQAKNIIFHSVMTFPITMLEVTPNQKLTTKCPPSFVNQLPSTLNCLPEVASCQKSHRSENWKGNQSGMLGEESANPLTTLELYETLSQQKMRWKKEYIWLLKVIGENIMNLALIQFTFLNANQNTGVLQLTAYSLKCGNFFITHSTCNAKNTMYW